MSKTVKKVADNAVKIPEFEFVKEFEIDNSFDSPLNSLREKSLRIYKGQPFPDENTSGWRKIPLRNLETTKYHLPKWIAKSFNTSDLERIENRDSEVFLIQRSISEKDDQIYLPNMSEDSIQIEMLGNGNEGISAKVMKKIRTIISPSDGKFAAFSHAFSQRTLVVHIKEGANIKKPVLLQEIIEGEHLAIPENIFIYAAHNSSATIIRQRKNGSKTDNLLVANLEIFLEESAQLDFIDIQDVSTRSWDIQIQKAALEKNAKINWFSLVQGGSFSKTDLTINLIGQASQAIISGLFLPEEEQQFYFNTAQNHLAMDTTSDLLYRGVIDGQSKNIWQGMIYIAEDASRSNGYQANHNLILNKEAKIASIPGLEILTDDVRCSHGVTITNIEQEQLFYLKSRGIPDEQGKELIVSGFVRKVLDRLSSVEMEKLITDEFISKINKDML